MKNLLLSTLFLLFAGISFGQSPLESGGKQLNFGVGLGEDGIPVYLGADFHLANNFTWGLQGNYRAKDNNSKIGVLGNVNYHFDEVFNLPSQWNVYLGANAGFYFVDNNGNDDNDFGFGAQLGSRYFFNDKWGVNLELGGGNIVNEGKLGLTVIL